MSEWSHLPNASHIDRILLDLRTNPDNWTRVWGAVLSVDLIMARCSARVAAYDVGRLRAWHSAKDAAYDVGSFSAWHSARVAILALIAWDESASYLEFDSDQLLVLSTLGDNKATLILPAVMAFELNKELA